MLAFACGDDDGGDTDAGADDGALCARTCDDGLFCNGTEACDPGNAAADEDGCVAGTDPCGGMECDEATDMCSGECPDADGDGVRAASCGGEDCDDRNADRYPGNTEVCDSAGLDEDCDPSTLGPDMDGDGYVDDECCNQQGDGLLRCGQDCDDSSGDINPEVVDACGNGDQDCDGDLDEDPEFVFYRDFDNDGFGNEDMADTVMACSVPDGYALMPTDCNDMVAEVSPSAPELCTGAGIGRNDDCDDETDEDCTCTIPSSQECPGGTNVGECNRGTRECESTGMGSVWGACVGRVMETTETCNGLDDDCDGDIDEEFECPAGTPDESGFNMCGRVGTRSCLSCMWEPPDFSRDENLATCDYCDDTGRGLLMGELGIATASASYTFENDRNGFDPQLLKFGDTSGSGTRELWLTGFVTGWNNDTAAAAYHSELITMGYGAATLNAKVYATAGPTSDPDYPGEGWAFVIIEEDTSAPNPLLGNSGPELAVPRDRNGMAFEWHFYDGSPTTESDVALLRHLVDGAADPEIIRNSLPTALNVTRGVSISRTHEVEIIVTGDRPDTAFNETTASVTVLDGGVPMGVVECGGTAPTPCGFRIEAGKRYHFGFTASTGTSTTSRVRLRVNETLADVPTLTIQGLCP